jgi:hypothetical protein
MAYSLFKFFQDKEEHPLYTVPSSREHSNNKEFCQEIEDIRAEFLQILPMRVRSVFAVENDDNCHKEIKCYKVILIPF